jgi:hypothetical protein
MRGMFKKGIDLSFLTNQVVFLIVYDVVILFSQPGLGNPGLSRNMHKSWMRVSALIQKKRPAFAGRSHSAVHRWVALDRTLPVCLCPSLTAHHLPMAVPIKAGINKITTVQAPSIRTLRFHSGGGMIPVRVIDAGRVKAGIITRRTSPPGWLGAASCLLVAQIFNCIGIQRG